MQTATDDWLRQRVVVRSGFSWMCATAGANVFGRNREQSSPTRYFKSDAGLIRPVVRISTV
jgi:hypothetical protein